MSMRGLPVTGGAENDGIRGVWGALPACPLVMSYADPTENPDVGGPTGGADGRVLGAEVEVGKWDEGGWLKAAAVGGDTGGVIAVTSGGADRTGEGGTKGSDVEGLTGGRDGWGVEDECGGRDCTEDILFGEEKELVAARKKGRGKKKRQNWKHFHLVFMIFFLQNV